MIVVDSSAVIAIMLAEPEAARLAEALDQAPPNSRFISSANYVEAGSVLAGRIADPHEARADLDAFMDMAGIAIVPVDREHARIALVARVSFGRGFGSRAKLNFGDCFAYALAKSMDAPLLFIGDDFAATDIAVALPSKRD